MSDESGAGLGGLRKAESVRNGSAQGRAEREFQSRRSVSPMRKICLGGLAIIGLVATVACTPGTGSQEPEGNIEVLWRAPLLPSSVSSPALHGMAADDDHLYFLWRGITALDLRSGERVWEVELPPSAPRNLVVRDGRVFHGGSIARALDAVSGAELWRFEPDTTANYAHSAVDDRAFYTGTRSARIYALDVATGVPLWATDPLPRVEYAAIAHSIVLSGDTVYAAIRDDASPTGHLKRGWIVALDRRSGTVLWRYLNETPGESRGAGFHAATDRMLLVNDREGGAMIGIDRFTGQEEWRHIGRTDLFGSMDFFEVVEGVGYVASGDMNVYALDPPTGHLHWSTSLGASASSSTVCGDYVFATDGRLRMLQRADGSEVANLFVAWDGGVADEWVNSRLLSHDGRVYFAGNQAVYAVSCEPVPRSADSRIPRITEP
jgi:outer membrane protein assembly factor BamB